MLLRSIDVVRILRSRSQSSGIIFCRENHQLISGAGCYPKLLLQVSTGTSSPNTILTKTNTKLIKIIGLKRVSTMTLSNNQRFFSTIKNDGDDISYNKNAHDTKKNTDNEKSQEIDKQSTAAASTQPSIVVGPGIIDQLPVEDLVNDNKITAASDQVKKIEFQTNKGKLIVTTTSDGKELKNVVLEKVVASSTSGPITKISPDFLDTTMNLNDINTDSVINNNNTTNEDTPLVKKATTPVQPVELKKRRERVDFTKTSLERNFITPTRAMTDFLLKPSDLENLPKTKRRSPYEQEPPITVYWRKDVEEKAINVWGTRENLLRECLKREIEKKMHQQNIFTVKRRLRDYRREIGNKTGKKPTNGLSGASGRVVLTAIGINALNCLFKICAWLYTGSHSMFAESIHSMADTTNQMILAYGIHKSTQVADQNHPYGYANMIYVSSLISGVGIFCVGTGLSMYHGITGLLHPVPLGDFFWAYCILAGSLISEGATLVVAVNNIRHNAKANNQSFKEFVLRGTDPCVNVVLFEDTAAVISVMLAAACMAISTWTGSTIPDSVGSLLVGCILGSVASFIIYSNVNALVGRSISHEHLNKINSELEADVMIRAIHDVKGIDMGNSLVRYKAEMDFDGRELSRFYLDKQDLNALLQEVKCFSTIDELEAYLLKHGENIVDLMGGEIDRIEMKLRKKFPEIRHCDLEIL